MGRQDVFNWLHKQNGRATIIDLLNKFPDTDPIELAEGFSSWMDSQLGVE